MDAAHFMALRGWVVLGKLVLYPNVTTTRGHAGATSSSFAF